MLESSIPYVRTKLGLVLKGKQTNEQTKQQQKHMFDLVAIVHPMQYASWDLAFHMIPFAKVDPEFAKEQLVLFLREWYMAPNGQIPAYEFQFSDVNPPVHAWAVWRVYKMTAPKGKRDIKFLARCFQKLILNFNWFVVSPSLPPSFESVFPHSAGG